MKNIRSNELAVLRASYARIDGLKPGDKVRWKTNGLRAQSIPAIDEVVEVFQVFEPMASNMGCGRNHFLDAPDFSMVFLDYDGELVIYAFDSRRFERVE